MRLSNGILLFLVLTVIAGGGAWPASSYTQEAEWTKSKESALRSLTAPASFFDGSPEEVAARVDNLLLLHEDPAEQTVGHGARGPVNKSSKQYHASARTWIRHSDSPSPARVRVWLCLRRFWLHADSTGQLQHLQLHWTRLRVDVRQEHDFRARAPGTSGRISPGPRRACFRPTTLGSQRSSPGHPQVCFFGREIAGTLRLDMCCDRERRPVLYSKYINYIFNRLN